MLHPTWTYFIVKALRTSWLCCLYARPSLNTAARGTQHTQVGGCIKRQDTTLMLYSHPGAASCEVGRAAWPQAWRQTWSGRGQGPWVGEVAPPGRSGASCWSAAAVGSWSPLGGSQPLGVAWGWSCHCHLVVRSSTSVISKSSNTHAQPQSESLFFFFF